MNWKIVAAIVVVLAVGGLGWYLQRAEPPTQSVALSPAPMVPAPAPKPVAPPPPVEEPPKPPPVEHKLDPTPLVAAPLTLDNSDGQVRAALTDFAPALAQWLTPEEQVRKWVMLVDQLAAGKLPMKNRPLQFSMPTFRVQDQRGGLHMDPANYPRANALIETVTAIPPSRLAQYYHAWRPTLDKAYAEVGGTGGFDKRLRVAIKRILNVRPLPAPPELVRPSVYYKYADERLEQASDVDKLFWRLGPDLTRRVQTYLRELEQEL
jgi:hypothetical protein